MNTADALKLMAKTFPGGLEVAASRLGKNPETFRKELSGKDPKFKLGESTAQMFSDLCIEEKTPNCYAYATAVTTSSGGFVRLEVRDEMTSPREIRAEMAGLLEKTSATIMSLTGALADDNISDNERRDIERKLGELFAVGQTILRGTHEINEAGKRSPLRAA